MKYGTWTFGRVEALLNRLGEENACRLLECREVTVTFDTADKRATVTADTPALTVWKTIKVGTGIASGQEFCSALEQADFQIGDWARDVLKQKAFTVASEETDIDLVVMSVADLGFAREARYDQICARALEIHLELCPAEVGPQLRLQYLDQPRGEWLIVAMEPIRDLDGGPDIFGVEHDENGRWLDGSYGDPGSVWDARCRFVFRRRR